LPTLSKTSVGWLLGEVEKEIPAHGAALESTIREIVKDELSSDAAEKTMERIFDSWFERLEKRKHEAPPLSDHNNLQTPIILPASTAPNAPETEGGKQP
jgi:hypothetical protein